MCIVEHLVEVQVLGFQGFNAPLEVLQPQDHLVEPRLQDVAGGVAWWRIQFCVVVVHVLKISQLLRNCVVFALDPWTCG